MLNNIGVKLKNTINEKFSKSPHKHTIVAKDNIAASENYWREENIQFLSNIKPYRSPSITLLNREMLDPSHKRTLPLSSQLSSEATEAAVLPKLKSSSLISLGQICDENCTIIFDKENLVTLK